jgi:hypothetical protein
MNMETRTPRVSSPVSQVQEASTEPPSGFILKLYEMIQGAADNIISVSLRCRSTVPFVYFEYRFVGRFESRERGCMRGRSKFVRSEPLSIVRSLPGRRIDLLAHHWPGVL